MLYRAVCKGMTNNDKLYAEQPTTRDIIIQAAMDLKALPVLSSFCYKFPSCNAKVKV